MRATVRVAALLAAATLVAAAEVRVAARADGPAAAPAVPPATIRALERAATLLAKAGRPVEMKEVLRHHGDLGVDAAAATKLRDACEKTVGAAKSAAPAVPDAAKLLRQAAADLVATLPALEGADRTRRAQMILALDGRPAAAHEALRHVQHEGRWVDAAMPECLARRAEIAEASRAARRLAVEFDSGESWFPSLEQVTGKKGIYVKSHNVALHSARFPKDKLERILGHTLRALAFSEFVCGGELKIPDARNQEDFILYASEPDYRKAIAEARENGGLEAKGAERANAVAAFYDRRGPCTGWRPAEADWESDVFYDLRAGEWRSSYGDSPQPCLTAGHVNWVLLQFVGRGIPGIAWVEEQITPAEKGKTSDRKIEDERAEFFRLSKSSLTGARAWLQWLARRGEDPAWSKSMIDIIGKITGNDLTKCTFVAEHLQETRRFDGVAKATVGASPALPAFEAALEEKVGDYEGRWRRWFLPDEPALADRVDAAPKGDMSPDEKRFLAHLDRLRTASIMRRDRDMLKPLRPEDELSSACRLHALYLGKHPEQLAAWPDAHEEYPDREGFSAQGCRAGLSSVIAPGVKSPEEAIDGWMATFYHRLPLLAPGLLRVGFAMEGGVAVLDCGSMVAPPATGTWCLWPSDGAKDVPRRFQSELPNPVPGADQSRWGHPVTAQFFSWTEEPKVRLTLATGGRPVDCVVSTPDEPSNPEHAPQGAFCLIPKATLLPGTTYTVTAEGVPQVGKVEWSFTTGK